MSTFLYAEINIFSITVLLTILIKLLVFGFEKTLRNKLFSVSVCFIVVSNLIDMIWKLANTKYLAIHVPWISVISFMYYFWLGCTTYFWFLFIGGMAKSKLTEQKHYILISLIPLAVLAVILTISLFNGCVFYYDSDMNYHRGPILYIPLIITYGYIIACIKYFGKIARENGTLTTVFVFFFPVLCGVIQIVVYEAPVLTLGITAATLLIYINAMLKLVSVDSLTRISTRYEFMKYLEKRMDTLKKNETLYLLFIDIDEFKQINDIFGHNEGDRALKIVAGVLEEVCNTTSGFCGRIGGDEFAIVQTIYKSEKIDFVYNYIHSYLDKTLKNIELKYSLKLSIGYAEYTDEIGSIDELVSLADQEMYNVKKSKQVGR